MSVTSGNIYDISRFSWISFCCRRIGLSKLFLASKVANQTARKTLVTALDLPKGANPMREESSILKSYKFADDPLGTPIRGHKAVCVSAPQEFCWNPTS